MAIVLSRHRLYILRGGRRHHGTTARIYGRPTLSLARPLNIGGKLGGIRGDRAAAPPLGPDQSAAVGIAGEAAGGEGRRSGRQPVRGNDAATRLSGRPITAGCPCRPDGVARSGHDDFYRSSSLLAENKCQPSTRLRYCVRTLPGRPALIRTYRTKRAQARLLVEPRHLRLERADLRLLATVTATRSLSPSRCPEYRLQHLSSSTPASRPGLGAGLRFSRASPSSSRWFPAALRQLSE